MERPNKPRVGRLLRYLILLFGVLLCLGLGITVFSDRLYLFVSCVMALISCLPFFLSFERGKTGTGRTVLLAVMVALSVCGRIVFAFLPHFKPVTAMVIMTGMYLGGEAGFLCGALSALLSNIVFGQGPWTLFQMVAWGLIGFLCGLIAPLLKKSKIALCAAGVFGGILFSFAMDIWTVLSAEATFRLDRYLAAVITAAPVTVIYAISNLLFLLILAKPIGDKLERVLHKYRL